MKHFHQIARGIDVEPVLRQLGQHPELWDQIPFRTGPGQPHEGCHDIWLRFRPLDEVMANPVRAIEPHFACFYPAWSVLTSLEPIVFGLMAKLQAVYLGGILITRIPPGKEVKPHADRGWHPEFLNTKVYVGLEGNSDCINYCEDEQTVINPGEAVIFNNLLTHSVVNRGKTDRTTLIICYRCEP